MSNGPKSENNLKEAFAGESQANRKYLAFAKQADKEGYPQVAKLFRAAAEAETIHAHNHLRALDGVKGTRENLQEAISGETHEFMDMYPQMIADAELERSDLARRSFVYANAVEKVHAALYQKALDTLGAAADLFDYYICPVCGHTVEKGAPDTCEVCGAKGSVFIRMS
ncbi:rubrerythrin family protein [Geomobilimonas luticola]|uniref:Rubrerythrin family protein n=1 Tax=Geomobilimonas luticola TaxID=1114878 RepID=A0ABS5SHA7_9BACT|nr:rubrerythrin family protein [Geomobilimonas luticola]MBT0654620.1 rubrerythrin family protein [Geomobilimonas luticola]